MNTKLKDSIIALLKTHNLTVETVQKTGFKVYISHYRYRRYSHDNEDQVLVRTPLFEMDKYTRETELYPKGGETKIEIIDNESGVAETAMAICNLSDPYVKSVGIRYALTRALRKMIINLGKQ